MALARVNRLREMRLALGLTQVELAARSGVRQNTISRLETLEISPSYQTVKRLVAAFHEAGVQVEDLELFPVDEVSA